jgi:dihydrodiol dehydrogenase / D-xylose 1-dehydrogenase (NADP)
MFLKDLALEKSDATTQHQVVAIGTSSEEKGRKFIEKAFSSNPQHNTRICETYNDVYNDAEADIVYWGTPHSCHMQHSLDAIAAGKHILCEKPFAINEMEAQAVIDAAKAKGVFVMEGKRSLPTSDTSRYEKLTGTAVWTRFFPVVLSLQDQIHKSKSIGRVNRMFANVGLVVHLRRCPQTPGSQTQQSGLGLCWMSAFTESCGRL